MNEAVAQEVLEAPIPAPDQVWDVVSQWPILLLFLAGFGFAYWLFVVRKKDGDSKDSAPSARDDDAVLAAVKGVGDLVKSEVGGLGKLLQSHVDHDKEIHDGVGEEVVRIRDNVAELFRVQKEQAIELKGIGRRAAR